MNWTRKSFYPGRHRIPDAHQGHSTLPLLLIQAVDRRAHELQVLLTYISWKSPNISEHIRILRSSQMSKKKRPSKMPQGWRVKPSTGNKSNESDCWHASKWLASRVICRTFCQVWCFLKRAEATAAVPQSSIRWCLFEARIIVHHRNIKHLRTASYTCVHIHCLRLGCQTWILTKSHAIWLILVACCRNWSSIWAENCHLRKRDRRAVL